MASVKMEAENIVKSVKVSFPPFIPVIFLVVSALSAANVRIIQLRVNGQNLSRTYGSYSALEVLDSDWAKNHFPDDDAGNLNAGPMFVDQGYTWFDREQIDLPEGSLGEDTVWAPQEGLENADKRVLVPTEDIGEAWN
jgi:hypothetical protein